jgi:hypothetical protein
LTLEKTLLLCGGVSLVVCVLVLVLGRKMAMDLFAPLFFLLLFAIGISGQDPWTLTVKERVASVYGPGVMFFLTLVFLVIETVLLGAELPKGAGLFGLYLVSGVVMTVAHVALIGHFLRGMNRASPPPPPTPSGEGSPEPGP